jgi:hypothetical protein
MRTLKDIFLVLSAAAIAVLINYYVLKRPSVESVLNDSRNPAGAPVIGR